MCKAHFKQSEAEHCADLARRRLLTLTAAAPTLTMLAMDAIAIEGGAAGLLRDLARAVDEYDQATTRKDIQVLRELVADDYMLVNSDASVQNKEEYLADFAVPGFQIDGYVMEQSIRKGWGRIALTGGLLRLRWRQDAAHHERLLRIAHVWRTDDDRWRIAYTQLTRVQG